MPAYVFSPISFGIGDVVEFETEVLTSLYPRWCNGQDRGGSGKWGTGRIIEINHTSKTFRVETGFYSWTFAFSDAGNVGGPRVVIGLITNENEAISIEEKETEKLCTCDIDTLMNYGCQCGGK